MAAVTSCVPEAAWPLLLAISCVVALCCSMAPAMPVAISLISPIVREIACSAFIASPVVPWIVRDVRCDLLGRLGGLHRKVLHLGGNHGEPLAGIDGTCCLDGCVQRQQVGLPRDRVDQADDVADPPRGFHQTLHRDVGPPRLDHGVRGDTR